MEWENTFHAHSIRYFANDEIGAIAFPADANDNSLKDLSSFLFPFDNFNMHPHRFSGSERGNFLLGLLGFEFI
jgi:hypothetical protein